MNPVFQTAFTSNNAEGTRTEFNFIGSLNLAAVTPPVIASATQTDYFNQEVFFIGGREFTGDPMPNVNTAFATQEGAHQTAFYYTGNSVPNWFKDENEKIVLYGALAQCFAYLQEDDQSGKYLQLMQKEIDDLNNEDRVRDSSGGNVQVQYTARGLI